MYSRLAVPLALVLVLAPCPPGKVSDQAAGRPIILLVHGRGMVDRDTAATRRLWLDGLRKGASSISRQPLIDAADVRLVWYADVLDPRSPDACEFSPDDPRARRDRAEDPELKSVMSIAGTLLGAVTTLVADSESSSQLRALAADASFLSNARKRCASEQRLGTALEQARAEGRPVIVVAHSLGSILAYDYLSTRADTDIVQELVTVGSPLGSPDLRRLLIGGDERDTLSRPASVKTWTNIHNADDPIGTAVPAVQDITTSAPADGLDPHEMVGYLRTPTTAREILRGWCAAFTTERPPGCKDVMSK